MIMAKDEFDILRSAAVPAPRAEARARAIQAALVALRSGETSAAPQGTRRGLRLTTRAIRLWSGIMPKNLIAAPALAGLVALPIAGYATFHLLNERPFAVLPDQGAGMPDSPQLAGRKEQDALARNAATVSPKQEIAPALSKMRVTSDGRRESQIRPGEVDNSKLMADQAADALPDAMTQPEANRDRVADFKSNRVRSTLEEPVSTFSIDADTASYSFVRRSLKEGVLPQADTVRVEEMINYFPYGWKGPAEASAPFNSTVSVMPTPWNDHTKLMHIAIKGYDLKPEERPKANLVFLIDVSGSMIEELTLLRSTFRLLVGKLGPDDTISIVTYAGEAGTVLEPTRASERAKILQAIDALQPGGSTAGEAGIQEAYRLAEKSFVKGGVNRVMLATDGDFNLGQTDDDDLKRIIEEKRKSGVFLSVFGFGRGNLNDRMMQTIAQSGNGTAVYIDTLAAAEKVLVEEASSTLFPIAKDVKIQVEFNPEKVSEYRHIGYETRGHNREDFNNDRIDAGEIGSGHAVTAIYEITPKSSTATVIHDLRYGQAKTNNAAGVANTDEYAFVKIRYKLPDGDVSKLITTPVTSANDLSSFAVAGDDQRFSVAVAAFGQKLRDADQTAGMSYYRIAEIADAARGADPFGYRAEFLSLVWRASALESGHLENGHVDCAGGKGTGLVAVTSDDLYDLDRDGDGIACK
jgi:Ca-activated chloride channel family protein